MPIARLLRIERPGGRYHVTARGNERKSITREERDRGNSYSGVTFFIRAQAACLACRT